MAYSPFFQTLHDETKPVGYLGRGTHYSVLRAVTWHDHLMRPLTEGSFLDFAVVWDEDHDTRVTDVAEELYCAGLLTPVRFIGERKGMLTLLLDWEVFGALGEARVTDYRDQVAALVQGRLENDWWDVRIDHPTGAHSIVSDEQGKVATYLQSIQMLWCLGITAPSAARRREKRES